MNKRGQGLSTNAIVLIVLGVIVLAVLILGFTMGWKNIAPWIGGGNNVDEIGDACSIACSTKSKYDFCSVERELTDKDGKEVKETCEVLATDDTHSEYGVSTCSSITCDSESTETDDGTDITDPDSVEAP